MVLLFLATVALVCFSAAAWLIFPYPATLLIVAGCWLVAVVGVENVVRQIWGGALVVVEDEATPDTVVPPGSVLYGTYDAATSAEPIAVARGRAAAR